MFTGIVEATGEVQQVNVAGTNYTFWIKSPLSSAFKIDQSVSHDGICLTVEEVTADRHRVTAINETIQKTNASQWQPGHLITLEQCLPLNGRLDGHLVQGHVDATAQCMAVSYANGSWLITIAYPAQFAHLVIEKGSITLNGISLTAFNITQDTFTVAIIPYTYEHTNIKQLKPGHIVNLEFDIIGKYLARWQTLGYKG